MFSKLKFALYGVLLILGLWFAWGFYVNYSAVAMSSSANADPDDLLNSLSQNGTITNSSTNAVQTDESTNAPAQTNAVAGADNSDTNQTDVSIAESGSTNLSGATNSSSAKSKVKAKKHHPHFMDSRQASAQTRKDMTTDLVGLVLVTVFLGGMFSYDVVRSFAHRAVDMAFDDDGPATKDPEYERAEQIWADGRHLEAVELMRVYLKKNPREQYVALRIAEIYEKDLHNLLAAAMEIEEVLKQKLNPDRWGWTAIHLCNLYKKLGRDADYDKLLHRIVDEYSQTSAAIKARKVLGIAPVEVEGTTESGQPTPPRFLDAQPSAEPPPEDSSNLPKGFRPKK